MTAEAANEQPTAHEEIVSAPPVSEWSKLRTSEDWWAVWVGALILAIAFLAVYISSTTGPDGMLQVVNPIAPWVSTLGSWSQSPLDALVKDGESVIVPVLTAGAVILVLCGVGVSVMGERARLFVPAFAGVFALAVFAYLLASQKFIKHYGLEYPLWALLVGMTISNTIRTPNWMKPAVKTEFYIKTGLVLLGATILLWKLLALGVPGIFVAWVVTPIVLITTYWFGQRVLKISSRSLNMTISADMSVCGVSAAIATAAACRAKKEELSLAIGLSLGFTVVMMIVLPAFINAVGHVPGARWSLGRRDDRRHWSCRCRRGLSGSEAGNVAVTVKMIQNILIGVIAFGVAVYWVTCRRAGGVAYPAQPVGNLVSVPQICSGLRGGIDLLLDHRGPGDGGRRDGQSHDQGDH